MASADPVGFAFPRMRHHQPTPVSAPATTSVSAHAPIAARLD
jgi:hypothetical protein